MTRILTSRPPRIYRLANVLAFVAAAEVRGSALARHTRHGPEGNPSHRIIHIFNWHIVSLDDYLADLQSQTEDPLTKDEMDRYQSQLVEEVS